MDNKVNTKILMFGAYCALLYPGVLAIGWWFMAGFVPPIDPNATSEELLRLYQDHSFLIRAGMVVCMFGALLAMPLGATMAYFISRIEGFFGPLSVLQVMSAACTAVLTFYPPMWWLVSIYRLDRSVELIHMLNDAAWLQWVGGLSLYLPTILTIAIAAFLDKSPEPVFPRWFGYACLWLFVLLLPGQLIFFFHAGPFAWNGLIAFYMPFIVFAIWFLPAFWLLRRAVLKLEAAKTRGIPLEKTTEEFISAITPTMPVA